MNVPIQILVDWGLKSGALSTLLSIRAHIPKAGQKTKLSPISWKTRQLLFHNT